ncbi:MAG: gamma-glutamyl-gamma-aminobutyrate hydrolase [Paraburkholderia sp.]|uniref:gamma-glutamyl-gamma-aminobutyrate hydrolase family protein n=1 Tax=Paraburkholderia sp. TaxID=1926495 RepID=UPI00122378CC|nr:gamma-glutamyl-gamma-aminobutyrate hydrolase family protein [Paraburkholderia sp.]TAM02006.1 MAG: gamma-glutamyl-gamma-aminobutyrate hydrolase [Paraburkholderia sp.]TAM28017.1 MAG: gamma-glutamyl-gamma-aminobutyrate hydrolase [Paraburkholderia sp.]
MSDNNSDHSEIPDGAGRPPDAGSPGTAQSTASAGSSGASSGSPSAPASTSPAAPADAPASVPTGGPTAGPTAVPATGQGGTAREPAPAQQEAAHVPEIPLPQTTDAGKTAPAPAETPRPGAAPAGFGQAPDFGKQNPPPPGALPPNPPRYLQPNDSAWSVFGRIVAARARQLFDRAGQRITQRTLRIGVSARIFHPEPGARGLRGKTLQYLEESIAHWVMSRDVIVFMIPTVGHQGMLHPSNIRLRDYAKHLDGLLLQGGADVSPQTYAEAAARPEWPGDRVRDMYELELLHEFVESGKPVLGVCRGCQLINVAFGGTLYQDIATDVPTAGVHVSEHYDQHRHAVTFPEGSTLSSMFPGRREAIVNSIHHQAVKTLGRDLTVEAVSAGDGLIEAVRYRRAPFVLGVQWHPEFHRAGGPELLDCTPLLDTFLRSARETRF